uniref:[Ribosomal protein bS18]-alanine N-acetyltransferase n=1 Tax=Caldimicrobium thiodismutans TaxID=1653476 RepID=A0A832LVM8_9BACT
MWKEVEVTFLSSEEEISILARLEREVFKELAWTEEMLRRELENPLSVFMLLKGDAEILGYLLFRAIAEEAELLRLAIRPAFQRRGLGSILFKEFLNLLRARGIKKIFLEVKESNGKALSFYRRWGFIPLGVRQNYYKNGENALLLTLKL